MKKLCISGSICIISLTTLFPSQAQTIYSQIGSTGFSLGYAHNFENFNLRSDINLLNYDSNFNAGNMQYDAKLKFRNLGFFADYHPFKSLDKFRLSGGFFLGKDEATAQAISYKHRPISEGDWVLGKLESKSIRPYLGMGWGFGKQSKGWSFIADIGASYSQFRSSYSASPKLLAQGGQRLQAEREAFQEKAEKLNWYPVIRLGISYRY